MFIAHLRSHSKLRTEIEIEELAVSLEKLMHFLAPEILLRCPLHNFSAISHLGDITVQVK